MDQSFVAIIVSYFPDENLIDLVKDLICQVKYVLIMDNGSADSIILKQIETDRLSNVKIIYLSRNMGIAAALNCGIKEIENSGYKYVFTFDQDSRIPDNYVSSMRNFITNFSLPRIGIVAPNFVDFNSNTQAKFTKLKRFSLKFQSCEPNSDILNTTFAISSGAMIPVSVFKEVGLFQEELFIDHVDTEFCLRLAKFNYNVIINCKLTIQHAIGNRQKREFLGLSLKPNNHRSLRRYYISRNGIYLCIKYFKEFPSFVILNMLRMVHEILCISFYEDKKLEKLKSILLGAKDGLIGRLGDYQKLYGKGK